MFVFLPSVYRRQALCLLGTGVLALAGALSATSSHDAEPVHLVVLHTNDVHGQVLPRPATWLDVPDPPRAGGLVRLAAAIRRERREAQEAGAQVLLLDGGDWTQGTPEGRLEDGRQAAAVMLRMGYDAMAVGNHEFDHGVDVFLGHLKALQPPALLANALLPDGGYLPGVRSHKLLRKAGIPILLVGLLTKHTPEMTHASTRDLTWQSPASALARVRQEAEPAGALVIPMTHLGVQGDRALARAHPDLALIVGGHSHTRLEEGVIEGRTLIVQTGAKATTLGRVDLWLDPDSHEVLRSRSRLIKLLAEPDDSDRNLALEAACKKLVLASEHRMGVVVGSLSAPLMRGLDRYSSSASGNLVTDVMRDYTGATVALHNRGGLRADLPAGEVTRRDLFRVLPFENHVVSMDMTGAQLAKLLRRSVEGQGHSGLEVSGVTLYLLPGDEGPKLGKVVVGGEDLVAGETYRVVTNSFLAAGGDDYGTFAEGTGRQVDPILLRDLLETAFGSEPLTPPKASRFVLSE